MKCFFRIIILLLAATFLFSSSAKAYECNNSCVVWVNYYMNLSSCDGANPGEGSDICREQRESLVNAIDIACQTNLSSLDDDAQLDSSVISLQVICMLEEMSQAMSEMVREAREGASEVIKEILGDEPDVEKFRDELSEEIEETKNDLEETKKEFENLRDDSDKGNGHNCQPVIRVNGRMVPNPACIDPSIREGIKLKRSNSKLDRAGNQIDQSDV